MSDLTKFNLKSHQYNVTTTVDRLGIDSFNFGVVIFNMEENIAFRLDYDTSDLHTAIRLAERVYKKGVVNLPLWEGYPDFFEYTQMSDIINNWNDYHINEKNIYDEYTHAVDMGADYDDGSQAYGEMLERQAQDYVDEMTERGLY